MVALECVSKFAWWLGFIGLAFKWFSSLLDSSSSNFWQMASWNPLPITRLTSQSRTASHTILPRKSSSQPSTQILIPKNFVPFVDKKISCPSCLSWTKKFRVLRVLRVFRVFRGQKNRALGGQKISCPSWTKKIVPFVDKKIESFEDKNSCLVEKTHRQNSLCGKS